MPITLEYLHEAITYTANFARPAFELWGNGGKILRGLYEALTPYNVPLESFQVIGQTTTAADAVVSVRVGSGSVRFSFNKIEASFAGFTEADFFKIPGLLEATTSWIARAVPDFHFSSHRFYYFGHFSLPDTTTDDFLRGLNPNQIKSAGLSLGTGAIFNFGVPAKKWLTQLTFDKSQHFPGALFLGFVINQETDIINYESVLADGRAYLQTALAEIGLQLPSASKD